MNDLTAYTIDAGFWSKRYRPEPLVAQIGQPPCDGCEHIARCARESLACCAYAGWLARRDVRFRSTHREPSAEWYDYAERLGEVGLVPPKCEPCRHKPKRASPKKRRPQRSALQALIVPLLQKRPGMLTKDIAKWLGSSHKSIRECTQAMAGRSILEVAGIEIGSGKTQMKRWRLCTRYIEPIVALLKDRPDLRAQEVGDAVGLSWADALGQLEMLRALGRVKRLEIRPGVNGWRVRDG